MEHPRATLEQWRAFLAVVDEGGYARAAEALHRSQSSVSHAVARLQERLGITLLAPRGRRMVLTPAGEAMARRARRLLAEAAELEAFGRELDAGWEAEIRLAVDAAFPAEVLMDALKRFAPHDRGTRVQVREEVLSGAVEALEAGEAELAVTACLPETAPADPLMEITFLAVAHADHPLHRLGRPLDHADLETALQVVIRDSGAAGASSGWLGAEHRWTVSSIDRAIAIVRHGLGYAWLPAPHIREALAAGELRSLPLRHGHAYHSRLYLAYGCTRPGPATRLLAGHLTAAVAEFAGAREGS